MNYYVTVLWFIKNRDRDLCGELEIRLSTLYSGETEREAVEAAIRHDDGRGIQLPQQYRRLQKQDPLITITDWPDGVEGRSVRTLGRLTFTVCYETFKDEENEE